jgi:ribosomal protein S18 acetylase RimI-like enzyme
VSPFGALADHPDPAAWGALARLVGPGGVTVLFRGDVVTPTGWTRLDGGEGIQMVGVGVAGAFELEAVELGPDDVDEVLDLIARTQPGPFATRTLEVGRYVGIRRAGRLVAMAGERLRLDDHVEVSAVCTDADHRGQGLARRVVGDVVAGVLSRGQVPFLHVAATNLGAQRLYLDLGFQERRRVQVTVLRAPTPGGQAG